MAILQTDANGIALTDNNGKALVKTSGSIIDYTIASDSSTYTVTPGLTGYTTEITNLAVSITPKSVSSKFLLLGNININPDPSNFFTFNFRRYVNGSFNSDLGPTGGFGNINFVGTNATVPVQIQHIDTPATTSIVEYRIGIRCSGATATINKRSGTLPTQSSIIVLEIV